MNPEESPVRSSYEKSNIRDETASVKACLFSVSFVLDEQLTEAEIRNFLNDLKSI